MKRSLQECYHQGKGNLTPPGTFEINHQFNRLEYVDHAYRVYHGTEPLGNSEYDGFIKCKLIYTREFELIIPDLIYIKYGKNKFRWFQFHNFIPGLFAQDDNFRFHLSIDISGGHRIIVSFAPQDFKRKLAYNSNIYKCRIRGPKEIKQYSTGLGKLIDNTPYIYLYHHTKDEFKKMILDSKTLLGSKWNYQGNKKIKNVDYCYFTSIDEIKKPLDLKMIAMATNERILLVVDRTLERIHVKIPRQSTSDRTATIKFLVDATLISNDHINERIYDEADINNIQNSDYFYEMCFPYIYRVGIEKGSFIKINKEHIIKKSKNNISPNYLVLGKGYDKEGIKASFHEEETDFIGKIFPLGDERSADAISTNIRLINRREQVYDSLKVDYIEFDQKD